MNNNNLLSLLLNETTVIKIEDNLNHTILFEKQVEPNYDQFTLYHRNPFDFSSLEIHWENKWTSFRTNWTHERQLFRFLWYEVRDFIESFKFYRENFYGALNLSFERDESSLARRNQYDLRAELSIRTMYEYGKQAIDLLRQISQHNQDIQTIISQPQNNTFLNQFKGTRNKFLIHYHNPLRFHDFIFDPNFFSVMGTGSIFEINVHIQNQQERRYSLYINHYADYFKLEEILISIISQF